MSEKLDRNLKSFLKHNKEGSFSTHANRSARLEQSFQKLGERFPHVHAVKDLKTKHIDYLVDSWKKKGLKAGTIKNRMSDLRWVSRKIDKQNIVKRTNDEYGIERREFSNNNINKAKELDGKNLERMEDRYIVLTLKMQEQYGLRREEAIKFSAKYADQGDHIRLKDTWCKGGRAREIPIRNAEQRQLLNEVKAFQREQKATAMIPPDKNYRYQLKHYENVTTRNGELNNHGLRHAYAQERFKEITGFECPKNGGKTWRELDAKEKQLDEQARQIITKELGHNRIDVVANYIGK